MSNKLLFTKMTGCGNDFLIIDARLTKTKQNRPELAKKLCDRNFGIGADGIFFIQKPKNKENNFSWDLYNADGSVAEMCGNGARCVARFCFDNKIAPKKMKFETLAGVVIAVVGAKMVEVVMPAPKIIFKSVDVPTEMNEKINVTYLNVGVPHVVKKNTDWSQEYLDDVGEFLRNHSFFKKTNGANATFYEVLSKSEIQAATYERGVEAITLACGTGAVAAAIGAVLGGETSPITVHMPGGILKVALSEDLSQAKLSGPAEYICKGQVLLV